ncbi:MAG: putative phage abortive infection protein [Bacteroidales bacterium]|nr:putative phage abortive infection protein [Bacteroidales bacterium]
MSKVITWGVVLILFVLFIYGSIISYMIPKLSDRGTFGDMFGAVNAFFSGLAFAGMIVTLNLQRKDMESQQVNVKKQLHQNGIQQFEQILFFLLGQRSNIIDNIIYDSNKLVDSDNKALLSASYREYYKGIEFINHINNRVNYKEGKDAYYLNGYEKSIVSGYINNLYQIFKYIDEADILRDDNIEKEFENKYKYCSLVKSMLTNSELILLEYFHEDYKVNEDLYLLCRHFALLENFQPDEDDRKKRMGPEYSKKEAKNYYIEYIKSSRF